MCIYCIYIYIYTWVCIYIYIIDICIYICMCDYVCVKITCPDWDVVRRDMFCGSVSPKLNIPTLLEVGHAKQEYIYCIIILHYNLYIDCISDYILNYVVHCILYVMLCENSRVVCYNI